MQDTKSNKFYELACEILEEETVDFIYLGVAQYIDGLELEENELVESFNTFLLEANDFFQSYLIMYERFNDLSGDEKSDLIFQYLNKNLPDWIYEETNFDDQFSIDKEDNPEYGNAPYDVTKIDIINQPFEVQSLYRKFKREPKELELSPDYQRNFVWTSKQKSRLIESILIKIPLPIFYIDARDEDKMVVVDGLQRLTSIFLFLDNKFKLTNLEFLKELNGKKFTKLERKYQRRIEDFSLLCNLVRPNTPADIALNIFTRINTLGTKLEVQEIRNAMYRGKSTDLLVKLSKTDEFVDIISEKKIKGYSKRAKDHAVILRYLAFQVTHYLDYSKNNMNIFLENTMKKINNMDLENIKILEENFRECMIKGKIIFDKNGFTKPSKQADRVNPISATLLESIGFTLNKYTINDIESNKHELKKSLDKLYKDKEFILNTSVATNNPPRVRYRFESMERLFKEIIGY